MSFYTAYYRNIFVWLTVCLCMGPSDVFFVCFINPGRRAEQDDDTPVFAAADDVLLMLTGHNLRFLPFFAFVNCSSSCIYSFIAGTQLGEEILHPFCVHHRFPSSTRPLYYTEKSELKAHYFSLPLGLPHLTHVNVFGTAADASCP